MNQLKKIGMLNREGMAACNAGRTEDALFQLIQAERIARRLHSSLHMAKLRNNIGLIYQLSGNCQEALISFRLAERQAVEGGGVDNALHRTIVRNRARLEQAEMKEAA